MSLKLPRKKGWSRERRPGNKNPNHRHGHNTGRTTREYRAWCAMKQRCGNPNHPKYMHYGGRGVCYDPRWEDFREFLADMGPAPTQQHTLERNGVNGDYCKDNCCWATWAVQAVNKRSNLEVTIGGVTARISEWCAATSIPAQEVHRRIIRGWDIVAAVITPCEEPRMLTMDGITQSVKHWSEQLGITTGAIHYRLRQGLSDHDALAAPARPGKKLK